MKLRFFADHCIPNSVCKFLNNCGYTVLRLTDHLPTNASDIMVITKAQKLDAILISLNGDFADIVSYPPVSFRGIVSLQLRNHPEILPKLLDRLKTYLLKHDNMMDFKGKLIIVEAHRIRVKE